MKSGQHFIISFKDRISFDYAFPQLSKIFMKNFPVFGTLSNIVVNDAKNKYVSNAKLCHMNGKRDVYVSLRFSFHSPYINI